MKITTRGDTPAPRTDVSNVASMIGATLPSGRVIFLVTVARKPFGNYVCDRIERFLPNGLLPEKREPSLAVKT